MLGLARNDSSQACAQSNALKIKQSVTQKLPLTAAAPCSVSAFFLPLPWDETYSSWKKERQRLCFVGRPGDTKAVVPTGKG
jgi:hypothetical protein